MELPEADLRKLLGAASGDAALVYLYLRSGGDPAAAAQALRMPATRLDCAMASLRQLGLLPAEPRLIRGEERPSYTEADVLRERSGNPGFSQLVGEAQRRLGRVLSTEELKILLSMLHYLGLPEEVIPVLINYCIQRNRSRGVTRMPSFRTMEREAYAWADQGVDTLEAAAAYVQAGLERQSRVGEVRRALGLENRRLVASEEAYVNAWLDWGFTTREIAMAYEKTCVNTGGLKWPYLNSILKSWHQQGLHTAEEIAAGDQAPARPAASAPAVRNPSAPGEAEREAVRRLMQNES